MTFTGKELDEETGLQYFGARYYDGFIGRWISRDKLTGNLNVPSTLNRYTYVKNNPIKYIDQNGDFAQIAVGAAIGAGTDLFIQYIEAKITGEKFVVDKASLAVSGVFGAISGGLSIGTKFAKTRKILGALANASASQVNRAVHGEEILTVDSLVDSFLDAVGGEVLEKIGGKYLKKFLKKQLQSDLDVKRRAVTRARRVARKTQRSAARKAARNQQAANAQKALNTLESVLDSGGVAAGVSGSTAPSSIRDAATSENSD